MVGEPLRYDYNGSLGAAAGVSAAALLTRRLWLVRVRAEHLLSLLLADRATARPGVAPARVRVRRLQRVGHGLALHCPRVLALQGVDFVDLHVGGGRARLARLDARLVENLRHRRAREALDRACAPL